MLRSFRHFFAVRFSRLSDESPVRYQFLLKDYFRLVFLGRQGGQRDFDRRIISDPTPRPNRTRILRKRIRHRDESTLTTPKKMSPPPTFCCLYGNLLRRNLSDFRLRVTAT
jgi:hypothetical protein